MGFLRGEFLVFVEWEAVGRLAWLWGLFEVGVEVILGDFGDFDDVWVEQLRTFPIPGAGP